ncbi:MAG: hypothetical protein AB7P03_17175 [Kofleriaceae bacterium]
MSTFNGFGTFYYGKDDSRDDGSYVATRYVVAMMLPIIPLATVRMRMLGINDTLTRGRATVEILEELPIRWRQVRRTYLRCWLLVPLLLLWPMMMLTGFAGICFAIAGKETTSRYMESLSPGFGVVCAINFIALATYLIWRARRVGLRRS